MRNFSSQVPVARVIAYFVHDKVGSIGFDQAIEILSRAFCSRKFRCAPGVNREYSGSELEVLNDFSAWVTQLNEQSGRTSNGAFLYSNLNEGYSLVFVGWEGYEDFTISYGCESTLKNMQEDGNSL